MAVITDYDTLDAAVDDYLARSDLSSYVPLFIAQCENKLYRHLRIRAMEEALSGTISSGVLSVPADYVELKYAYIDATPIRWLQQVTPEQLYKKYPVRSGTEYPSVMAREGSNFIFGPYPGDYDVVGLYYKRLPHLNSSSPTTNWFTSDAPDLLLYGSLLEAEPFIKNDARLPLWKQMYDMAMQTVMGEEKRESRSGGSLAIRLA